MQTPSTTTYSPGDVVLVRIRFTNQSAAKKRPAVVVSVPNYHAARLDAVVVALTTSSQGPYFGDCPIVDWSSAGLMAPTKAKGVIETLERAVFEKKIGALSARDFQDVQASIRLILGL